MSRAKSATSTAPVTVESFDGLGDERLVAEWDALLASDPDATLFQSARWLARWAQELSAHRRVRSRVFRRGGKLIGMLVETHELHGQASGPSELIRIAGGDEVTDYLGPVAAPEDRAAVARAYVALLAEDREWDEVVLNGLSADAGWHEHFAAAARELEIDVTEAHRQDVCPHVGLEGGFDGYLARLPGRLRQELVRKARKLARDAGPFDVHRYGPSDVVQGIEDFLAQAQRGEDEKSGFFRRPEMQQWFRALVDEYGPDGTLRVHRLDIGELPAAMTVSLVEPDGGTWGLYNSVFDPTLAALAPGMVLIWELLEQAAEEGCVEFDLLRGDEPYKYRFGASDREVHTLTLVRASALTSAPRQGVQQGDRQGQR